MVGEVLKSTSLQYHPESQLTDYLASAGGFNQNADEKREQNEKLAKLRADTSIQKTVLSKTLPNAKDMMTESVIIGTDQE